MFRKIIFIAFLILCGATIIAEARQLSYKDSTIKKKGDTYSIDINYPEIKDRVIPTRNREQVNGEILKFVNSLYDRDLAGFAENFSKFTPKELERIAGKDLVEVEYRIVILDENFISVRFEKYLYNLGAVHGNTEVYGFNYHLKKSKYINLADFFEPGADYLKQISDFCIKDLNRQINKSGIFTSSIAEGAGAKEENLKQFTLGRDDLTIYFGDYQVADYASGPQEVKIPLKTLKGFQRD